MNGPNGDVFGGVGGGVVGYVDNTNGDVCGGGGVV